MTTLSVNGKQVQVDDSFLKLTPDQQNATVDEIAKSMGSAGNDNVTPSVSPSQPQATPDPNTEYHSPLPQAQSFANGFMEGIPVVGPLVNNAVDFVGSHIASAITGRSPEQEQALGQQRYQDSFTGNEGARTAGNIAGSIAPFAIGAGSAPVAQALGMSGSTLSKVALGAASNAGLGYADTLVRGGTQEQAQQQAGIAGALGAAAPVVGGAVNSLIKPTVGKAVGTLAALFHPDEAAQAAIGGARAADIAAGAPMLSEADQAAAAANGQPLLNIDSGGPNTRALARTASVANPEARATFNNAAQDRFQAQGSRTSNFIDQLMGGEVNAPEYQANAQAAASQANQAAYSKAYSAPEAQSVFTPEIQQLMQSDQFKSAVRSAESTATDKAAITGEQAVRSPFNFDANGVPSLKTKPDGSTATPNLQFWNEVKMNLDSKIGVAQRAGDKAGARDLIQLKNQLTSGLDSAVPSYQQARQGAAAAFQADDALSAGQKFVTQNLDPNTARTAMAKFTPQDREAFAVGFAGSLKNKILNSPNSLNVINKIYGSDAAKRKIVMALGQDRANQFEQFVRVENLMDGLRKMGGGSDTANKLVELGALGTGGGIIGQLTTGDWREGSTAGLALGGARILGTYANRQMMSRIAQILASDDPAAMARAVKLAASNPEAAQAVKSLQKLLGATVKASPMALGAVQRQSQMQQATQP